ncbi:hypothetical protein FisN_25Hh210 [Fistulifera solaris]|uniref:Methyltransferase type 11 domain-containing protein n=1 Tax=Fistulifera solaris TaxID=1519565 RepID=A0A1Z5K6U9_FISSO|nr:hypothetical protein FisN_25Hh210 [Fistulifera solaris]|eukprot:GAX21990.1 hypothetical protein FisN_25Hh210 [Fistulifera solaris]
MSLRGRYVIDRVKRAVDGILSLPVPPYHNPAYWEGVYHKTNPYDTFEWGSVNFDDLREYTFVKTAYPPWGIASSGQKEKGDIHETLGLSGLSSTKGPLMMLGCGTSELGTQFVHAGFQPVVQVDVSSRLVEMKTQQPKVEGLSYIQDDATVLSAFEDETVRAVVDKGLFDALFCASATQQCHAAMAAIQRVLQPNSRFLLFSFSQPEFLLPVLAMPGWKDVEIRNVNEQILLYMFRKNGDQNYSRRSVVKRRR